MKYLFIILFAPSFCIAQTSLKRDLSFADSGIKNTGYFQAKVGMQLDGKFVFVRNGQTNVEQLSLSRLTENGIVDETFGNSGSISYSFSQFVNILSISKPEFQSDGKIIITGSVRYNYGQNSFGTPITDDVMCVWRFNANGTLDQSFNNKGYYAFAIGNADDPKYNYSQGVYVRVQTDGKIVIAGTALNSLYYPNGVGYSGDDLTVWRVTQNGILDTTFNNGKGYRGVDYYNSHNNPNNPYSIENITGFTVKNNGEIIVGYHQNVTNINNSIYWGYYVFSANGQVFSKYTGGLLGGNQDDGIKDLISLPDNNIILAKSHNYQDYNYSLLYKLNVVNELVYKKENIDFGIPEGYQKFYLSAIFRSSNKILMAGLWKETQYPYHRYIYLVGMNEDGTIDTTFNNETSIYKDESGSDAIYGLYSVFVQASGRIVTVTNESNQLTLKRYLYDSTQGVKESQSKNINIYPNPVRNTLQINSKENISGFEIYSQDGRKVLSRQNENVSKVDFSNLPNGNYILKLKTKLNEESFKIIKSN